eukprot:14573929-Alexandrium_andersonii.AAC.1
MGAWPRTWRHLSRTRCPWPRSGSARSGCWRRPCCGRPTCPRLDSCRSALGTRRSAALPTPARTA